MTEDSNGRLVLLRLEGEQINRYWELIKQGILEAVKPEEDYEQVLTNVLRSLLSGQMQCWIVTYEGEPKAIFTTAIQVEVGGIRSLLIYSMNGYSAISLDVWKGGLKYLRKFAKLQKCEKIVAYSNVERVLQVARMVGGETEYTFISIPVEEK